MILGKIYGLAPVRLGGIIARHFKDYGIYSQKIYMMIQNKSQFAGACVSNYCGLALKGGSGIASISSRISNGNLSRTKTRR